MTQKVISNPMFPNSTSLFGWGLGQRRVYVEKSIIKVMSDFKRRNKVFKFSAI